MVLPIRNVTVQRELTPFTHTEPHRSNIHHRELTPARTEPYYRSNVHHRELTHTEIYRSNWTRDVNENAYLQGRIDELNQQLNNANGKLRDLRLDVGQLQLYNNILSQKNNGLHPQYLSDLQDIEFEED
ncbi:hypothetical protein RhiirA5_405937 [Rhizophagus irregularis]|uniref:Uncharacterized protein n=1 Tax=Rhizophagus irregularis TaxID=588596 RepID=A0A2I1FBU2_9GLOM|nr:hypothetical protein RhiirA5_405937 [Rhizophagus irregularis]PKC74402.1 hypothetical protein RhiirA1_450081 [Rhizophagus irregularis]PKY31864.1 hypothetical protein RhiirB3_449682 [Rhizophagus irregularis]CAB5380687.1 unnamed protein product [Rhizophagus irregularis]